MSGRELVGRRFVFEYGENLKYEIDVVDEGAIDLTLLSAMDYSMSVVSRVPMTLTRLRPALFVMTWEEPGSLTIVTQFADFANGVAAVCARDPGARTVRQLAGTVMAA